MSQENVEIVRRVYDAFNSRDAEAVTKLWSEDGEWRPAFLGGGSLEGTVYYGRSGIADFVSSQAETWKSLSSTPLTIRDFGSQVLVEDLVTAIGRAGGTPVEQRTWNVFVVGDGEILSGIVYATEREALEAVGLSE